MHSGKWHWGHRPSSGASLRIHKPVLPDGWSPLRQAPRIRGRKPLDTGVLLLPSFRNASRISKILLAWCPFSSEKIPPLHDILHVTRKYIFHSGYMSSKEHSRRSSAPVSYTHLDVYKRQLFRTPTHIRISNTSCSFLAFDKAKNAHMWRGALLGFQCMEIKVSYAVSYTHLFRTLRVLFPPLTRLKMLM